MIGKNDVQYFLKSGETHHDIVGESGGTTIDAKEYQVGTGGVLGFNVDTTDGDVEIDLQDIDDYGLYGVIIDIVDTGGNGDTNNIVVDPASNDDFDGGTDGAAITIDADGGNLRAIAQKGTASGKGSWKTLSATLT